MFSHPEQVPDPAGVTCYYLDGTKPDVVPPLFFAPSPGLDIKDFRLPGLGQVVLKTYLPDIYTGSSIRLNFIFFVEKFTCP